MSLLRNLLSNKIILYVVTRYGTYALQFLVSIVIAAKLGPYFFGVYGFILLIFQYFSQINFGIPHSLNVLVVHNKNNDYACKNYLANSIYLYLILSLIIVCFFVFYKFLDLQISDEYPIEDYLPIVIVIAILSYFNSLFTIYVRARNKVNAMALMQSINVIMNLLVVFIYNGEKLIYALLISLVVGNLISFFIAKKCDVFLPKSGIDINKGMLRELTHKGFFLFFYNSAFYFILLSIRTIVSSNYTVEEFGLFTFSFTIANAFMMLIDSISAVVYPKILDLLSSDDESTIIKTISILRTGYISTAHMLIYLAVMIFPIFILFLPNYSGAVVAFNFIALSILANANSFGYSTLLVARNKEKTIAIVSLVSLLINIVGGLVLVHVLNVDFAFVIIATLVSYMIFSILSVVKGASILKNVPRKIVLRDFFPIKLLIPYIVTLLVSVYGDLNYMFLPFAFYLILNYKDIYRIKELSLTIWRNPNIGDI